MFWKTNKKLSPTLLRCAHSQTNRLFELSHIPDPKKCVFGRGDLLACPIIHGFVYQFKKLYKFGLIRDIS